MSPKAYTEQEEQLARFAKAMGHPARMAILRFLAGQESCFFGDIHEVCRMPDTLRNGNAGHSRIGYSGRYS